MNKFYRFSLMFCFLVAWLPSRATSKDTTELQLNTAVDHSYKPIVFRLNEDGTKYLRLILWHQMWVRATENNPGTTNVSGKSAPYSFDVGLRRSRIMAFAQVSPRFLILTHFGINNHTFVNGGANGTGNKKPGMFIHDAWTEYAIINEKLYLGAGLHYWNGISRLTNTSTLNMMTLDAPIFNWPNIELTDQFARQFGIYAKGKLGKLDYRMALNKPFAVGNVPAEGQATNRLNDRLALQSYVNFQFLDQESNQLPFMVGTYLGAKEIFNIGFGFHHHPKATASLKEGVEQIHDVLLIGTDVFYEKPVGRYALSAYSTFYNYNFGPNYIRSVGIMNTGQVSAENASSYEMLGFNGPGNSQPAIGTGTISYTQLGLLLPPFRNQAQLMPYLTFTRKNFEIFRQGSNQYDLGINYFIGGHNAKITAQYGTRPLYNKSLQRAGRASELTIQTHIYL